MTALAAAGVLWLVFLVHAAGESLLASVLLVVGALALWTYTSRRTTALRYLFPGVATALVFVVFPMLYTVDIGFTNTSSRNLLDRERVRGYLLDESLPAPGSQRGFSLHGSADAPRLVLADADGRPAFVSPPLPAEATGSGTLDLALQPLAEPPGPELPLRARVERLPTLRRLALSLPDSSALRLVSLREFAATQPLYTEAADGTLTDRLTGVAWRRDDAAGFYTSADGDTLQPGWRVHVGLEHYRRIFSEGKFREPFASVFVWTVLFAALSVLGAAALGMLLAVLLAWERLPLRGVYRTVLFLPYAVPGFISILVFKGLFNQNLGEVNLILGGLFGIRPAWFSDPLLARTMLLLVNIWLGFPYMMVLCTGLIKAIPADLYEASAVVGASPWVNFRAITLPLVAKPLTPLLIAAFAFNFNNFVLVSLLTGGRPDMLDAKLPAGTTDILVSYTWRIAFQDSGQQFGLAAAVSTVIFLIVAAVTLLQLRFTRTEEPAGRG